MQILKQADSFAYRTAGKVWYHVSPMQFEDGAELIPGGSESTAWDYSTMTPGRQHHVWVESDLDKAQGWRHSMEDADLYGPSYNIYEVEPAEEPQPWEETGEQGWTTPRAIIKRQVR